MKSRITCVLLMLSALSATPTYASSYDDIPDVFLSKITLKDLTVDRYVAEKVKLFSGISKNADALTQQQVDDEVQKWRMKQITKKVNFISNADGNGDGSVSKDEVKDWVAKNRMRPMMTLVDEGFSTNWLSQTGLEMTNSADGYPPFDADESVREFMRADLNSDGVISYEEMRDLQQQPDKTSTIGRSIEILTLDPDKDGVVTKIEFEELSRKAFSNVDLDGDGVIGQDERKNFSEWEEQKNKILHEQNVKKLKERLGVQ